MICRRYFCASAICYLQLHFACAKLPVSFILNDLLHVFCGLQTRPILHKGVIFSTHRLAPFFNHGNSQWFSFHKNMAERQLHLRHKNHNVLLKHFHCFDFMHKYVSFLADHYHFASSLTSLASIAVKSSTEYEPISPSPLLLTAKEFELTSFSPTTRMYGILSFLASRIL